MALSRPFNFFLVLALIALLLLAAFSVFASIHSTPLPPIGIDNTKDDDGNELDTESDRDIEYKEAPEVDSDLENTGEDLEENGDTEHWTQPGFHGGTTGHPGYGN